MKKILAIFTLLTFSLLAFSQTATFDYTVDLKPISISGLPGLHSFAYGQSNGKWLLIGGRKDGLHARQPFNAFPLAQNNSTLYVIDINTQQMWNASLSTLPTSIQEQLQSTNMNFYQDHDSLYIIGGYAYSNSSSDHITFPYLTSINVPALISHIINGTTIAADFKQISDNKFANTGGRLGKIDNTFYLVGGQKFTGRYNPMGNPTYVQEYASQIQKFTINNSGSNLSFSNYTTITDAVHLHRRDYNLVPQIYPNGDEGYMISSGVFQTAVDLPFLYPVDITASAYTPITTFNQYLSNYHSSYIGLFDSSQNAMHSLFFGGMSQYSYQGGTLMQDNLVPFTKTISRVTRSSNSTLNEYQLPTEMPAMNTAGSELIINTTLPHYESEIIKLDQCTQDTILIGHIIGGISSSSTNPFSVNQTSNTSASSQIYAVRLIKTKPSGIQQIDGKNPYAVTIFPNPIQDIINIKYERKHSGNTKYFISNEIGQIIQEGELNNKSIGMVQEKIVLKSSIKKQVLNLTIVFDEKYYVVKKLSVE